MLEREPAARPPLDQLGESILRALESSKIGVTIVATGKDGRIDRLFANAALADVLGVTLEQLNAMPVGLPIVAEERPRFEALLTDWSRGDRVPTTFRITIETPAGKRVPIEVTVAITRLLERSATVSFIRDLTERMEMEDALRRSEARFRQLAEGAPDGIALHVRGKLVYANPPIMNMLGRTFEELSERGIQALLSEDERAVMADRLRKVATGSVMGPRVYHFERPDIPLRAAEIHSIAFDHEGQPAVLSFARDVSERVRLVEELRRADRLAALGTLAAAVAHEVNNPLTYVLLHLRELQAVLPQLLPGAQGEDATRRVHEALEGAERVRIIVRDLLSFVRSDPVSREPVCVEQVLESAIKLAGNVLRHHATVVRDYEAVRPVSASPRLEQVFLNLLVNAAQAIPERRNGPGEIRVSTRPDGQTHVLVEVADDGPGIPEADLPRVFEPFFTTKPEGIGTGLGLAISKTIVESLGGDISVTCPPGGGTVVRVRLPATDDALPFPATARPPSAAPAREPTRARLLVIDDEVRLARLLATLIGERHDVEVATSAAEALAALRSGQAFDVIFCDLMMPEMTGMELHEIVCRERPELGPRFVFLTGGAFTERAAQFVSRANVTTILKPFDLGQIEAVIEARLRR